MAPAGTAVKIMFICVISLGSVALNGTSNRPDLLARPVPLRLACPRSDYQRVPIWLLLIL